MAKYVWKNGELIDSKNALDNNFTHALHYGSGVFEGIRFYETNKGSKIFRLREHIARLVYSASVLDMKVAYTQQQLEDACLEVVKESGLVSGYIRPILYYGDDRMGLNPSGIGVNSVVGAWGWGSYL